MKRNFSFTDFGKIGLVLLGVNRRDKTIQPGKPAHRFYIIFFTLLKLEHENLMKLFVCYSKKH